MIPLKLQLKNFLSYGEEVTIVDFSNHSLICLSGKNGNGKSALLDAISWAMWGQARKTFGTVKPDENLIRLGQTRMLVSLEFLCSGQKYRVRREYAKTYGRPYVSLDVEMFNTELDSFVSLTEKTVRMTQERIEKIVGLDFDTFANSSFLRQGQSNEFSKKTPRERKKILANILGLCWYDEMQKLASDCCKTNNDEKKVLVTMRDHAAQELSCEKEIAEELKSREKLLKDFDNNLKQNIKDLSEKEKDKIDFLEKKYLFDRLNSDEKRVMDSIMNEQLDLRAALKEWKNVHSFFLKSNDLKSLEKNRKDLIKKDDDLRKNQQLDITLQEKIVLKKSEHQKLFSEKNIAIEKERIKFEHLEVQLKQKKSSIEELIKKKKNLDSEQKEIDKKLKDHEKFKENFEKVNNQFDKRKFFYHGLIQKGNQFNTELLDLERKKKVVKDKNNPSCPLCDQVLTSKRKDFLAKSLSANEIFLSHRIDRIKNLIKKLKVILIEQKNEINKIGLENDFYGQLKIKLESLKLNIQEIDKTLKREKTEIELLEVQKNKLEKSRKNFSDKELLFIQKEIDEFEKERKEISYDKKLHKEILDQVEVLNKQLQEFDEFKEKLSEQNSRKEEIKKLCKEIKVLKKELCSIQEKIKKLKFDKELEKSIEKELSELKDKQNNLVKEKDIVLQQKGSLENRIQRLKKLKEDQEVRNKKIKEFAEESLEYQTLASMFGKDGIQALLIEDAIPEVVEEANNLLSKLTDNKSQIFIESLRDLKSGGVRESLDIHISDVAGARSYEMFSGGEAFRIDFALRIAISKLLARRAGASLQTLIIDEGFGSQDEEGLQLLMDTIYMIKDDFEKVIVVSHLTEFKDNFPVHFIVEKNAAGSFVNVEERG